MACGVCGGFGHEAQQCPHKRAPIRLTAGGKNKRCRCCGQHKSDIERHDTLGQGNDSDFLELCLECHLNCCHDGDFHNAGRKPLVCCFTGHSSYWRR